MLVLPPLPVYSISRSSWLPTSARFCCCCCCCCSSSSSSYYYYYYYYVTPWSRILLENLIVTQLLKKFTTFHGTRGSVAVFTIARHWFLSWARWIQSTLSHPISIRFILILPFHVCLGLPSGHFPTGFPTKILYAFLISPVRDTYPALPILLYFVTLIIIVIITYGE
jgi:hypothetical protein